MKLSKPQVDEWYEAMSARDYAMARMFLLPFVLFARVWDEIDVPQVAGKLIDEAWTLSKAGDERGADFLVDAAADLRKRANAEPQG